MYLPEEMHGYLAREGRRRGLSMAEIAREAIAEYRSLHDIPSATGVSALIGVIDEDGPVVNDASRVDEVVEGYFAEGGAWDEENGHADTRRL